TKAFSAAIILGLPTTTSHSKRPCPRRRRRSHNQPLNDPGRVNMDVTEYRKRYEAELAAASELASDAVAGADPRAAVADPALDQETRASAIQQLPLAEKAADNIKLLLDTLKNSNEPGLVRNAALRALKGARFLGPLFEPYNAEYMEACRNAVASADTPQ